MHTLTDYENVNNCVCDCNCTVTLRLMVMIKHIYLIHIDLIDSARTIKHQTDIVIEV